MAATANSKNEIKIFKSLAECEFDFHCSVKGLLDDLQVSVDDETETRQFANSTSKLKAIIVVHDAGELDSTFEALFSTLLVDAMLARIDSVESGTSQESFWPRIWASKPLIIMTGSTLLSLLRRDLLSLENVNSLVFKSVLEGGALIDPANAYRKIMSEYYTPLTFTQSCWKPKIMGFGIGFKAYSELIGTRPNVSFSKVCEILMGLGKAFHSSLVLVDVDGSGENIGLDRFFTLPQETIIEFGDSNLLLSSETRCKNVFDFALLATFKILQFKLTGIQEDNVDFPRLLAYFEAFKNGDNRDEKEIVEIQARIEKLQDCLSILAEVGPFAAAVHCSGLLYELDQAYTLQPLSSEMNGKMWSSLQIRESEITPQDFSPKIMALLEFLDVFLAPAKEKPHQSEMGRQEKQCLVLVEDGEIAYSVYKLLKAVSSVFIHSKPCLVSHLDEMQNFRNGVYNTLILTDFNGEKDYSTLIGTRFDAAVFFDASAISFEYFDFLESLESLQGVFSSASTSRHILVKSKDKEILRFLSAARFNTESSRFSQISATLQEKGDIGLSALLMGQLGGAPELRSKTAKLRGNFALQQLSWFCSKNQLSSPYLVPMWPLENAGALDSSQLSQEWASILRTLTNQAEILGAGSKDEVRFLSSLQAEQVIQAKECYVFACCWNVGDREFIVYGAPRISEKLAQNSAALLSCDHMHRNLGYLDGKLRPVNLKPTPAGNINSSKQIRPKAFEPLDASSFSPLGSCSLYLTVFVIHPAEEDVGNSVTDPYPPPYFSHQYVAIATKNPVPVDSIPCFDIYPRKTERYNVMAHHFHMLGESINCSAEQLAIIEKFQAKVWADWVGLKEKGDGEDTRWFSVVPVLYTPADGADESLPQQVWSIDWAFLEHCCVKPSLSCTAYELLSHLATTESPTESVAREIEKAKLCTSDLQQLLAQEEDSQKLIDFLDQAISDVVVGLVHDPTAHYSNLRIDPNINGNTEFLDEASNSAIRFVSDFERKGVSVPHLDIFGLQGQKVHRYTNVLSRTDLEVVQEEYLSTLLDAVTVLPISEWFLQQLWAVPSLVSHLESHCIVEDFFEKYEGFVDSIPRPLIYPAFIHASTEKKENYERLEFLGDAALKLAVSLYLYQYSEKSEGDMTDRKGFLVSNATLNTIGRTAGLDGMIQATKFNAWFFKPPKYESRSSKPVPARIVSVKMCADVVESIAGAFYLDGGIRSSWRYFEAIGMVPGIDHVWLEIKRQLWAAGAAHFQVTFQEEVMVKALEQRLGYTFTFPTLLVQAMTHSSYSPLSSFNYERLEFIGDAVLDLVLAKYTYDLYPEATPQVLSNMRVNAVNNEAFARMSFSLGLHERVRLSHLDGEEENGLKQYVAYLETLEPYSNPYTTEIEGPKMMGDIFESLIGAIFLDCLGDLDKVWQVLLPLWKPYLDKYISPELIFVSELRQLYEMPQVIENGVHFRYLESNGSEQTETCQVYIADKLYGEAAAHSKKLAKELAAKQTLSKLQAEQSREE